MNHDLEAGFSGGCMGPASYYHARPFRASLPPPPMGFFYDDFEDEEPMHFLDACFLCKKALSIKDDIFMYRGDTPFCSVECRELQIDMDETKERKESVLMKQRSSASKAEKIHVRVAGPGTVVTG